MAAHYGLAVVPARTYKPRDKAKAEAGVLLAERWIIARLRNRRFTGLAELNLAITELLEWINARPFKKLPGSRRDLFEALDRPALRPLPASRYEFATWRRAKVNIDYHIEVRAERHYYSVPYRLAGEIVEIRLSAASVEVFCRARRVASHVRRYHPGYSTDPAHMPEAHRRHTAVDTGADRRLGRAYRAGHRPPDRGRHGRPPPSRARVPVLPGHHPLGPEIRSRPPGGGLRAGAGCPSAQLPLRRVHLARRPGPPSRCPPQPRSSLFPSTTTCRGSRYYQ